jgi:hypothetical protein
MRTSEPKKKTTVGAGRGSVSQQKLLLEVLEQVSQVREAVSVHGETLRHTTKSVDNFSEQMSKDRTLFQKSLSDLKEEMLADRKDLQEKWETDRKSIADKVDTIQTKINTSNTTQEIIDLKNKVQNHDDRITTFEKIQTKSEGAIIGYKILWGFLVALGGFAMFILGTWLQLRK